jgi:Xaa-Pro aminopeptidase
MILKPKTACGDEDGSQSAACVQISTFLSRCLPFVHTIGINEAEAPFFGPRSLDVLKPGMTVCIDVSYFGHPEFHGVRIETGYEITEKGPVPMSPKMDRVCTEI